MPSHKLEKTSVNDGLAKIHEATELLTEERIEQLAEEARQAARENNQPAANKPTP